MFSNLQERNAPLHAGFQFIQPVYTVPKTFSKVTLAVDDCLETCNAGGHLPDRSPQPARMFCWLYRRVQEHIDGQKCTKNVGRYCLTFNFCFEMFCFKPAGTRRYSTDVVMGAKSRFALICLTKAKSALLSTGPRIIFVVIIENIDF